MIARHEILPKDFEYNKWFRMTASTAIPSTNSEGKKSIILELVYVMTVKIKA